MESKNTKKRAQLYIKILELGDQELYMEGHTTASGLDQWEITVKDQKGKSYPCEIFHLPNLDEYSEDGEKLSQGAGFRIHLPIRANRTYAFYFCNDKGKARMLKPIFGKFAKLSRKVEGSYFAKGSYLVSCNEDGELKVSKNSKKRQIKAELKLLKHLCSIKEYQIAFIRAAAALMRKFKRNEIWIICDRSYLAGDNGEALFKYIQKVKPEGIKAYFMLDEKSRDFQRMQSFGKVLKKDSFSYKCKFLCADKILSSHADPWTTNAFGEQMIYVRDLFDFSFVFLQHGIGMNDMSTWLHKHNKNIKLLLTSAKPEYDSFFMYPYEYDEDVIKLTGLPRYDYLEDEAEKRIVFLPTWRKRLAGPVVNGSSERIYSEEFKTSEYFQFYNSLINDEKLIQCMRENGYVGEFYVHPSFDAQAVDFEGNDTIKVINETAKYNEVYRKNALLITDYSSAAFDFAYMKKPIVYAQFDKASFFEGHVFVEGYFDFEQHGFGPVCADYGETVATIMVYIKEGCQMQEVHKERVDAFFAYTDRNNCQRVLDQVLAMK